MRLILQEGRNCLDDLKGEVEVIHNGQATLLEVMLAFQTLCGVKVQELIATVGVMMSNAESRPVRAALAQNVVDAGNTVKILFMSCDMWLQIPF